MSRSRRCWGWRSGSASNGGTADATPDSPSPEQRRLPACAAALEACTRKAPRARCQWALLLFMAPLVLLLRMQLITPLLALIRCRSAYFRASLSSSLFPLVCCVYVCVVGCVCACVCPSVCLSRYLYDDVAWQLPFLMLCVALQLVSFYSCGRLGACVSGTSHSPCQCAAQLCL